jgi:hypothetical protein
VVEKNLGKTIQAKQDKSDSRLFYTEAFVVHNNAVVRGALTAITQPTQVSAILQICEFQERDFYGTVVSSRYDFSFSKCNQFSN